MTVQFPEKTRKRKFSLGINTVDKTQSWVVGRLAGPSLHLWCLTAPVRYLQGNTGLVCQGMSERVPATNPFQKRTERRRSSAVQGPQAWKSFESVLKMHNLSPHPRLVNSNQLLTTSTGNFYVYASWRHILEIRQILHL